MSKLFVGDYMTREVKHISSSQTLDDALHIMREYGFRHLPVVDNHKLVGVISDRDIKLAKTFVHPEEFSIGDVMSPEPFSVLEETNLNEVIDHMTEHRLGCAIVVNHAREVIGIFTRLDAMRAFRKYLKNDAHP